MSEQPRTIEDLAAEFGKPLPEVLEAAKLFTTRPGSLLDGEVPAAAASRLTAYFATDK